MLAEVVREYDGKADGRIVYHRLLKNEGIAGNTNAVSEAGHGRVHRTCLTMTIFCIPAPYMNM